MHGFITIKSIYNEQGGEKFKWQDILRVVGTEGGPTTCTREERTKSCKKK